ncbi:MAG: radical SAM protein [Deltaproteobacteria bacterium]|nr:radical SAM protein [Deltaproteobacteria bacterium]MBW1949761.1 radical SAM protein [Deltaproteobacteria bacterium]MBW2008934.1 radical SAM protein [Deltaproteobacteria bacterium]MBW2102822.1 radical SAM protein [Deltaproteobacteria bacterium]MBW2347545.1 radical SAM protein [Deltaproteobacteria bacterium]
MIPARRILPKMIRYRLFRLGIGGPGMPFNLTYSVTNRCQSRCKTCRIWELYRKDPAKAQEELDLQEIERIFRSMGRVEIFNISGGEPFLREDLAEIVSLACTHLAPSVIHIPTNALAVERIKRMTGEILEVIRRKDSGIQLTVKPSLDHVGEKHDELRGVPGNFEKVMAVFRHLKTLKTHYPNLHAELGTVISAWNVDDIPEIARFVREASPDSYRNEVAERRSEMFNEEDPITPTPGQYERAIRHFVRELRAHNRGRPPFQRITNAFRLVYYDLAVRALREQRQPIPCYAGISNAHMNPYGEIWACCTLGYERSMGSLRAYDYDFRALWKSPEARQVRSEIRQGRCHCPLANQAYSNILLHGPSLLMVLREVARS